MTIEEKVLYKLGEIVGEMREQRRDLRRIRADSEMVKQALHQQGKALGELPCREHGRRISDLYESVGQVREDTGRIVLADVERQAVRRWWRRVLAAIWDTKIYWLPLLGAALAAVGLAATR
jgi:precorrin isomerase